MRKSLSTAFGILGVATIFAGAFTASAARINDDDYPDPSDRRLSRETLNPNQGVRVMNFANGSITIDDAANVATIRTSSYGTFLVNLDDAALKAANNDSYSAAQMRWELSNSLHPAKGVLSAVRDKNGNGILDEQLPVDTCGLENTCTGFVSDSYGGQASFVRAYQLKKEPFAKPDAVTCKIACESSRTAEGDFAVDLAETGLACGMAETPPTFALCAVMIYKMTRAQRRRNQDYYTCHVECTR